MDLTTGGGKMLMRRINPALICGLVLTLYGPGVWAVDVNLTLSSNYAVLGSDVIFALFVSPPENVTCQVSYGQDQCLAIFTEDCLSSSDGDSFFMANYTFTTPGFYLVQATCDNGISNGTYPFSLFVEEPVANLAIIRTDDPIVLEKGSLGVVGTVGFSFSQGSSLQVNCEIDGQELCGPTTSTDNNTNSGSVAFQDSYFADYGYHTLKITLFNYVSSESVNTTIIYEERITDLVLESPDFVLLNTSTLFNASVDKGSNVGYAWTMGGFRGTDLFVMCSGNSSNSSYSQVISTPGMTYVEVVVSNLLGQLIAAKNFTALFPVEEFSATLTSDVPGADLLLTPTLAHTSDMGNLTVDVTTGDTSLVSTFVTQTEPDHPQTLLRSLPQGEIPLTITVASPISSQTLTIHASLWDPINVSLHTNTYELRVGDTFSVEIINTTAWGHSYEVDFGDGTVRNFSDIGILRTSHRVIDYTYTLEGVYAMQVNVSNGRYYQLLEAVFSVFHAVPDFTVSCGTQSWITLPPGLLALSIEFTNTPVTTPGTVSCSLSVASEYVSWTESVTWASVASQTLPVDFIVAATYAVNLTCSNQVSLVTGACNVEVRSLSADDFTVTYPRVIGYGIGDDLVNIDYTIHLFDDTYIPPSVYFIWDSDDGSSPVHSNFTDWTHRSFFASRGDFNSTLSITVFEDPPRIIPLPITVGLMTIQANITEGIVNSDVLGIFIVADAHGANVSFDVEFEKGRSETCLEEQVDKSFILAKTKLYSTAGVFHPRVIATWGSESEELHLPAVAMLWPVSGLALLLQDVDYPTGTGPVDIVITDGSPAATNVTCTISYSDDSPSETVETLPVTLSHTFSDLGEITVTAVCANSVTSLTLVNTTTVTSSCFGPGQPFLNQGQLTKLVSESLSLSATVDVLCKNLTSEFFWNVTKDGKEQTITQPHSTVLSILPGELGPGTYTFGFQISFREHPDLYLSDTISVSFLSSDLVVVIKGGTSKSAGTEQSVTVDAASESTDPDVLSGQPQGLTFSWSCGSADNFSAAQDLAVFGTLGACQLCLNNDGAGKLVVPPECLEVEKYHVVYVQVSKDSRSGSAYQILHITQKPTPQLELRCTVNCLVRKNTEFSITMESVCLDCSLEDLDQAEYSWVLYRRDSLQSEAKSVPNFGALTSTGVNISTISIRPNSLLRGYVYELHLQASQIRDKSPGTVSETFSINFPPYGGSCQISPQTGQAVVTKFRLSCSGWRDEGTNFIPSEQDTGDRLSYQFLLASANETSLLYSGDSQTAPPIELVVGDPESNFEVEITARVFDPFTGMAELNFTAKVTAPLDKDSGVENLTLVSSVFENLNTELSQSVKEGDIQQTSRFIESASSVINTLVLPVQNTTLPEDPSPWLGAQPLDVPQGNSSGVEWNQLWTDLLKPKDTALQDKLTEETEGFIGALASVANSTEDLSLDTVFYVTSTMGTLVTQPKYVSGSGLETAVDAVRGMTDPLDNLLTKGASDTLVDEVLASVLSCVDKMFGAALPEVPVLADPVDIKTVREKMETENSYLPSETLSEGKTAKERADLHDNERAFFMSRSLQQQQYEAKKKQQLAKSVTKPLQDSVNKALDVASKFLVVGQEPKAFTNSKLSASVEKVQLNSLKGKVTETDGVQMSMDIPVSDSLENPDFVFKTTVFHDNPFVWDEDGVSAEITSAAVTFDFTITGATGNDSIRLPDIDIKQKVAVPNSASVTVTTVTPTFIPLDRDQFLYHRVELESVNDAIFLFITSYIPHVKYDVYFRSGEYPTSLEYDYKTDIPPTLTHGGSVKLKVMCPEGRLPQAGPVYIALKPYALEVHGRRKRDTAATNQSSETSDYGFGVGTVGCKTWKDEKWSTDQCSVSRDTSETSSVCECTRTLSQPFTLATSFVVPVNKIDFSTVFTKIDLLNNGAVFATIISLLAAYVLLAVWVRYKDCTDFQKWGISPLVDNDPRDRYVYIVTVTTGMRPGAGTKSRVGIVISGEDEDTGIRELNDGIRDELPRQSVVNYMLCVPYPLGELMYVRIWQDDSGPGDTASWFLHDIVIEDIQKDKRYIFPCDRWLAVDEDDGKLERTLPVSSKDDLVSFGNLFNDNIRTNITDSHLWLSVAMRPKQSHFTRLQRLSCCLSLLFLTMIASAMFYGAKDNVVRPTIVAVGSFRFSLQEIYVSFISILIVTPVNLAIVLMFKKSKPRDIPKASILDRILSKCCPSRFRQRSQLAEVMIVQRTYSPKEKMLPHWCLYVAWGLLFASVALPAFFLFLYSQEWGKTKSEEWLTAFLLSFFESLIVVDPIKVVVLTVILSVVFRKPREDSGGTLDKEELGKGNSKEFTEDTPIPDKRSRGPLEEEAVRRAQTARREETTAFGIVKEVTFYSIFLCVIFTIGYTNRDHRSYALKHNIFNMLVNRQADKRLGLVNVSSRKDFFRWMNETALPSLFEENYYEGSRRHWRERHFLQDLQNYRVGPPRLRQLRTPPVQPCQTAYLGELSCQKGYGILNEDDNDYCVGWKTVPCPERESVEKFTSAAWRFTSSLDIWGLPVWGRFNTYNGGGYISEMGVNYQVSSVMLKEEFDNLWLDRQTRAVSLEFTLYNPGVNLFCYVTLLAEFPETGGAMTSAVVLPFRAFHHVGPLGAYVLFNQILFAIYLLGGSLKLVLAIRKQKKQFFKSPWHILDVTLVISCYVSVVMFAGRYVMVKAAVQRFNEDQETFVNFQHITMWDDLLVSIVALICFFCTLRMIKILGYNHRISSISSVIQRASGDLMSFSAMFAIVFVGFAMLGYLLFGRSLTAYSTLLTTVATLITSIIGKTPFDEMRRAEPVLAQVYFAFFVFFVVFILLTMFLCILNESICAVRAVDITDATRHRVLDILLEKLKESFGMFKTPPKTSDPSDRYKELPLSSVAAKLQGDSEFALKVFAFDFNNSNAMKDPETCSVRTSSTEMSNRDDDGAITQISNRDDDGSITQMSNRDDGSCTQMNREEDHLKTSSTGTSVSENEGDLPAENNAMSHSDNEPICSSTKSHN